MPVEEEGREGDGLIEGLAMERALHHDVLAAYVDKGG